MNMYVVKRWTHKDSEENIFLIKKNSPNLPVLLPTTAENTYIEI